MGVPKTSISGFVLNSEFCSSLPDVDISIVTASLERPIQVVLMMFQKKKKKVQRFVRWGAAK